MSNSVGQSRHFGSTRPRMSEMPVPYSRELSDTIKRHPPNRPLSPIPAHDWTRPISYANNNFPDWSHGHPKAVSGMFKSRGTTYEPPRNLFSGLGADAPRSTPGVRHAGPLWPTDSLRAVEPRHAVTPFATWVTTNNTYGRPWHTSNNHFERTDAWLA